MFIIIKKQSLNIVIGVKLNVLSLYCIFMMSIMSKLTNKKIISYVFINKKKMLFYSVTKLFFSCCVLGLKL